MNSRRLALTIVVSLCSITGGLLLMAPSALAVTPPVVEEAAVLDVSGTSATLQATINPEGNETTYLFEYGTSEAYGSVIPDPDGVVGSGSVGTVVSEHIQGLSPRTTYHYRVLAVVASRNEVVPGTDETFTTQPVGNEFALPDDRQWELVSPQDKHGAAIYPIEEAGVIQASESGNAITYPVSSPTELEPKGYSNLVQVLSVRGADGWSSQDIATPHSADTGLSVGQGYEYRFFSPNLSLALVEPQGPFTPLSPEATERTSYLRHDFTCEVAPATCYMPLVTADNVPPGTKIDPYPKYLRSRVNFVGATPDLSDVVLSSGEVGLTSTPGDEGGLYEWAGGQLQLISILPEDEGGMPAQTVSFGSYSQQTRNAISEDGSRIFWSAPSGLYMRDMVKKETLRIGGVNTEFEEANTEGSRVFFVTYTGGPLEECDVVEVAGRLACNLTQLTPETQGFVLGSSEDGSYVYFVSRAALTSDAVSGEDNLYLEHNSGTAWESPDLISVLSSEDYPDWNGNGRSLGEHTARVSPDGRYLAFMSDRSLTGYDNHDAVSGQPDEEVYLYDASTDKLVCASCNPTGARPTGVYISSEYSPLVGGVGIWSEKWLAGNIPGWTPYQLDQALYQSRYLSDSGRLFFTSNDALVPQDINGTEDVYEYEPPEVGGCSVTDPAFSERSGGCVNLISSGASPEESAFMDASENGEDVFFLTSAKLVPIDTDTSYDIYDAHACSSAVPCIPQIVSPPPCETADSCKGAITPQPPIFGDPSSATFSGMGNTVMSPSGPVVKVKSLTRAQKLARALKACHEKKVKKARAKCEREAKRLYGKTTTGKTKSKKKSEG